MAWRIARAVLVAALGFGVLLAMPYGPATADSFGTDNGEDTGPLADNFAHTFCWGFGFDANLQDNASWAMQNSLDAPTEMVDSLEGCTGNTDLVFFDADLPGYRGQYYCQFYNAAGRCNRGYLTVDPVELNIGANDEEDTTKTMCHEIGHSVGGRHGDAYIDCLINGEMPNLNIQWRTYSPHHIWHINDVY